MILCARTQSAAFYSGHSAQSPLVLNHIEPHYKDKVGSVPRSLLRNSCFSSRWNSDELISQADGFPVELLDL